MRYTPEQQRSFYLQSLALLDPADPIQKLSDESRMDLLKSLIVYHEWRYYIRHDPVISDFEYDQLYKQLEQLEDQYPEWVGADSPTRRVSADLSSDFPEVPHLSPMLSLANSYDETDLREFDQQVRKFSGLTADEPLAYAVEPKFDGGSIALVYENDLLVRAATRGNGERGEDITHNARVLRSLPLRAAFSEYGIAKVELRGEVLIRKDIFEKINASRAEEGLSLFANARNTASGGLRMKDPRDLEKRGLEAFIYQMAYTADAAGNELQLFETHDERIALLGKLGFKIPEQERKVCQDIAEATRFCLDWQEKRETYPYEIDGMVLKVNDLSIQQRIGSTSHHPRWAIAFKFRAKQATTRLLDVEYQVGKIGSITPVAKVAPVQLAGVTISSISLHNEDFIRQKDLQKGDTVLIERAGDVIPYIVKAMPELRDGSEQPIVFPQECPVNDTETPVLLVRAEGEAAWRCPNCVCGAQDLQRIIFHVSKDAMDIDGMGKSIVERFYELGWIRSIADIYRLDYEKIAQLEGFGQKSANNLRQAIDKAKQNPIHRLLHSLSIHHLGKKVSRILAARIGHVLELGDWSPEDFTDIKDIGPIVAENVRAYFQQSEHIELLQTMESLGVNLTRTDEDILPEPAASGPLLGKTILFTGTLQELDRKTAQQMAQQAGARVLSAVSANLNILVAGEKAGSKLSKARELGTVEILSEAEFLAIIRAQNPSDEPDESY